MPKGSKKRVSPCERHDFSLRPRSDYLLQGLQGQHYQVSFCTHPQPLPKQQLSVPCLNCPSFNRDANFATPTFILASEQGLEQHEGQRMRQDHERRMVNYTDQKSSMNIPKPRSKNSYCSICRHSYSDYLEHIQSQPHRKRINASEFNRHILELTHLFKNPPSPPHCRTLTKTTQGEEHSVEIISNPTKKVKPNETLNQSEPRPGNWSTRLPFSNPYLDQAAMLNPHRLLPSSVQDSLNHYNYNLNINMNLFLSHMPPPQPPQMTPPMHQMTPPMHPPMNQPMSQPMNQPMNQLPMSQLTMGQMGMSGMGQVPLGMGMGQMGQGGSGLSPFLDMQYQAYLMGQMNRLQPSPFSVTPPYQQPRPPKPIAYIIIDE